MQYYDHESTTVHHHTAYQPQSGWWPPSLLTSPPPYPFRSSFPPSLPHLCGGGRTFWFDWAGGSGLNSLGTVALPPPPHRALLMQGPTPPMGLFLFSAYRCPCRDRLLVAFSVPPVSDLPLSLSRFIVLRVLKQHARLNIYIYIIHIYIYIYIFSGFLSLCSFYFILFFAIACGAENN